MFQGLVSRPQGAVCARAGPSSTLRSSFSVRTPGQHCFPACPLLKYRPVLGSITSSFAGLTLHHSQSTASRRLSFVVQANGKKCLGCTKEGTRRARTRTSGFRARLATKGGRKVLKARRAKGRKMICPAHEYKKWSFLPGRTALPS